MTRCRFLAQVVPGIVAALIFTALVCAQGSSPPMGWSEWDAYGLTVTEADFKENATVLATLRQYGWQYALIDAGWYIENPVEPHRENKRYILDGAGRLIPAANRFPSATGGAGFKPLADWLHRRGLKFGIHVMPGIPRQAVIGNLPIAGSSFLASDAADTTQTCSWDSEFYVAKDNAAGQAYYDSMVKLYAQWGVDYIKLGCVSDHPFHPSGIRQIAEAIRKSGRPMVLSLSPGPVPIEDVESVTSYARMWRVSEEHWDFWSPLPGQTGHMVGLREAFDLLAKWAPYAREGHWVDGDVLPSGWLGPHPAWGEARHSRETEDEQRTEFALWAIARSPLMLGANLTKLDSLTRSLITNREIIEINQKAWESHPVKDLPAGFEHASVWEAEIKEPGHARSYFAFFNLADSPAALQATWKQLGLDGRQAARSVWDGKRLAPAADIQVTLPPHGSAIYCIE